MIHWEKVPPERLEEVKALDARIKAIESGYIQDYGNIVSVFFSLSELLQEEISEEDKNSYLDDWNNAFDYLTKMYHAFDQAVALQKIPLTEDTAPYFVCRKLYQKNFLPILEIAAQELKKSQLTSKTVQEIQYWSKQICDVGHLVPRGIIFDLNRIPGCEERKLNCINVSHKLNTNPK